VKWLLVCLLLASSAVLAQDGHRLSHVERDVAGVERDVASIDTSVRQRAVFRALCLESEDLTRRICIKLARDPDPGVRSRVLGNGDVWAKGPEAIDALVLGLDDGDRWVRVATAQAIHRLPFEEIRRIPVDRFTRRLPAAVAALDEADLEHVICFIDQQVDAGVAVSVSTILGSAFEAPSKRSREGLIACALRATTVAPLSSASVPALRKLLARDDTREHPPSARSRQRARRLETPPRDRGDDHRRLRA
jgi:hypothetical protein